MKNAKPKTNRTPEQEIARLKEANKKLRAAVKAGEERREEAYDKIAALQDELAGLKRVKDFWADFQKETLDRLGLSEKITPEDAGRQPLTKVMATIEPGTGRILTPVLKQIKTLPPFGPMIRAAMEIEAISDFVFQTVQTPKNFHAYSQWVHLILHNLACRLLDTIPHIFKPGKEEDDFMMLSGWALRQDDITPEIREILDTATYRIALRIKRQWEEESSREGGGE